MWLIRYFVCFTDPNVPGVHVKIFVDIPPMERQSPLIALHLFPSGSSRQLVAYCREEA